MLVPRNKFNAFGGKRSINNLRVYLNISFKLFKKTFGETLRLIVIFYFAVFNKMRLPRSTGSNLLTCHKISSYGVEERN